MARVNGVLTGTAAASGPRVSKPFPVPEGRGGAGPDFVAPIGITSKTAVYDLNVAFGGTAQIAITVAGTYGWLCPAGITQVYVECFGGGGTGAAGSPGTSAGGGGGGGGAYARRVAVPVTPGTIYTLVVGGVSGDTIFTGDSGTQVVAKGGSAGSGTTGGAAGSGAGSTGDITFSGGTGGNGHTASGLGGGGGGASANSLGVGSNGTNASSGSGAAGGVGASGGGSGGTGGDQSTSNAQDGSSPGGGGGGGGGATIARPGGVGADGEVTISCGVVCPFIGSVTAVYTPALPVPLPFITSHTTLYALTTQGDLAVPFIARATSVYTLALNGYITVPFTGTNTVVYTPTVTGSAVLVPFISTATAIYDLIVTTTEVDVPFIDTVTDVYKPTLMQTFTGDGVSQVSFEVVTSDPSTAYVTQVTLELVVPMYKGLHVWQRS